MSVWLIIAIVVITGVVVYFALNYSGSAGSNSVMILKDSQEGSKVSVSSLDLPRSFNEKEGAVYSWTGWVLVKNFTSGFGQRRRIFSRGDAPGLYIDSTSNSLILAVNTYGSGTETVLISNIPAMKWIHVGIVVDQTSVNIYINGTLRVYHTLNNLPKPGEGSTEFGSKWDGVVGQVEYYPYALNSGQIFFKASQPPPSDLIKKPATGPYFDMTWYTGRL